MSHTRARIALVGDTILNLTYRASLPRQRGRETPFNWLGEEVLELERRGEHSLEGMASVARYLAADPDQPKPILCTGTGAGYPEDLKRQIERDCDLHHSVLELGGYTPPVVVRVLRNVASNHVRGLAPDLRPQLRLDLVKGEAPALDEALDQALAPLGRGDLCLLRTTAPRFFAWKAAGTPNDPARATGENVNRMLERLRRKEVLAVVDLRPLPPNMEIIGRDTIVSTTIGRLQSLLDDHASSAAALVERAFWRFSPAAALVCFAMEEGTFLCVRDAGDPSKGTLLRLPIERAVEEQDPSATVNEGDAFVAAFVDHVARAGGKPLELVTLTDAVRAATAALLKTRQQSLGAELTPLQVKEMAATLGAPDPHRDITDPMGSRIAWVRKHVDAGTDPFWKGLVAPEGGALRPKLERLRELIETWKPRRGKDLIAIFGESRCGKEFPLKRLLGAMKYDPVGPVNAYRFLNETYDVLEILVGKGKKGVLLIDEVLPGEDGRALLNLTAEKQLTGYTRLKDIDFTSCLVILMSSMDPDKLLVDLRGRLQDSVTVPPLRDRWNEIPYLLPNSLERGLASDWGARKPRKLKVSERLMSALLRHNYLPVPEGAPGRLDALDAGLDQQNFRAFEDLLAYLYRGSQYGDEVVLAHDALPDALSPLASSTLSQTTYFVYTLGTGEELPQIPTIEAT